MGVTLTPDVAHCWRSETEGSDLEVMEGGCDLQDLKEKAGSHFVSLCHVV